MCESSQAAGQVKKYETCAKMHRFHILYTFCNCIHLTQRLCSLRYYMLVKPGTVPDLQCLLQKYRAMVRFGFKPHECPTDVLYAKLGIQLAAHFCGGMRMFDVRPRVLSRSCVWRFQDPEHLGDQRRPGLNVPGLTSGHAALVALIQRTEQPRGFNGQVKSIKRVAKRQ